MLHPCLILGPTLFNWPCNSLISCSCRSFTCFSILSMSSCICFFFFLSPLCACFLSAVNVDCNCLRSFRCRDSISCRDSIPFSFLGGSNAMGSDTFCESDMRDADKNRKRLVDFCVAGDVTVYVVAIPVDIVFCSILFLKTQIQAGLFSVVQRIPSHVGIKKFNGKCRC